MRKKIGSLDCVVRKGSGGKSQCVVLLHGYGADANDLAPLAEVLDPREQFSFYFPEAPLEVPIGPMSTGRAWFPIAARDLESGVNFSQVRPPGLDRAREQLADLLFHLNADRLILGGFSQGAMLATDTVMSDAGIAQGLVILSGALLDEVSWRKAATKSVQGLPFFQSHGTQDPVLPFANAQRLNQLLLEAGAKGSMTSFHGGHEIPMPILTKLQAFL